MNVVNYYALPVAASASGTSQVFVGQNDCLQISVPNFVGFFRSAVMEVRLQAGFVSGTSAKTAYFYDYVNKTPSECVVTISTGGVYEIPNAGGAGHLRLQFDTSVTQAGTINLIASRITY